jgi:hypothetical protein
MDGSTYDLIDVVLTNLQRDPTSHPFVRLREMISSAGRRQVQCNPSTRAQCNVAHHHDFSRRLHGLFLDRDRQYSRVCFRSVNESLDDARAFGCSVPARAGC